jgi:hypothetical protein
MTAHRRGRALKDRRKSFEAAVGVESAFVFLVLHSRFLRASTTLPRSVQNYHIIIFPLPGTLQILDFAFLFLFNND